MAKSHHRLHQHLSVRVWALAVAFEAQLAAELEPLGLSVSGFRLVGELTRAPEGLRTGELARRLGVKPPSVTTLVARLIELGVVEVTADPDDARGTRVRLTRNAPLRPGVEVFKRLDRRLTGKASARRRREFDVALEQLLTNLQGTL